MSFGDRLMMALPWVSQLVFIAAVGACIGSLINVLVYRLPRGIGVVTPASRCPSCETRLTWRENIPIFGWLLLRGRCRFCRTSISPEYPIVEAFTAAIFAVFWALWYTVPDNASWLGAGWGSIGPEWAENGVVLTWPLMITLLTCVACLIAMTLVDAKTFTIPLILAWVPTALALLLLPLHAAWFTLAHDGFGSQTSRPGFWLAGDGTVWRTADGWLWAIATPGRGDWAVIGAALAAPVGIAISLLFLRLGWIRQSFADYDAWEKDAIEKAKAEAGADAGAAFEQDNPTLWIQYPHARREMLKELAFLAPPALLMVAGAWAAKRIVIATAGPYEAIDPFSPAMEAPVAAPLWLVVLSGVLLGYVVGGGVVWATRIFGSIAFGKEAMGIGDVHLLAAVGACFGWIDAVLAFFAAAFVGLAWTVLAAVASGGKLQRAMPFGPYLALGALLVLLCKPLLETALGLVFAAPGPVDIP